LKKLEDGLSLISRHIDSRHGSLRHIEGTLEAFVDVFDWLRIGWVDEKEKWKAYIRFLKDGKEMRSEFEDYPSLRKLRDALHQADG